MQSPGRHSNRRLISREAIWWWLQRLTAVALVPFCLWFVYKLLWLIHSPPGNVRTWMAQPCSAVALVAFMLMSIVHSYLGMRSILQDYVPHANTRKALDALSVVLFCCALLMTVLSLGRYLLSQA